MYPGGPYWHLDALILVSGNTLGGLMSACQAMMQTNLADLYAGMPFGTARWVSSNYCPTGKEDSRMTISSSRFSSDYRAPGLSPYPLLIKTRIMS